jgi:hypothetical protein
MNLKKTKTVLFFALVISLLLPGGVYSADKDPYGPRIELGFGGLASRMQSRPEWSSKYFNSVLVTGSYRVISGLSVQGGLDTGQGPHSQSPWLDYGPRKQVSTDGGSYMNGQWVGLRYDIPLKQHYASDIHTIYFAGGVTRYLFGTKSKWQRNYKTDYGWDNNENPENINSENSFKLADMKGYYLAVAARWRFNLDMSPNADSWLGAYGVDLGVRYLRHNKHSLEYDNIDIPKSNFNSYQVFATLFLKLKLFY